MSAPILALLNLAPLRSNRLRRAMTRAPEKLAPLNVGAAAREIANPDETTRPRRLAFDRSALVKFARIIQARSSFAPESNIQMHKRGRLGTYEDLPPLLVDDVRYPIAHRVLLSSTAMW